MTRVGNDIVDLGAPGALQKAGDHRFADRVFSDSERRRILRAPCPSTALWSLWAAKEACFKVVQKLEPEVAFSHRAFEVHPLDSAPLVGRVRFRGMQFLARWLFEPRFVHCICQDSAEWQDCEVALAEIPAGESESETVRRLALRVLQLRGIARARIVRPLRFGRAGPPMVVVDDHPLEYVDLSLSHDGRYAAAAIVFVRPGGRRREA